MKQLPIHTMPTYSEKLQEEVLFHYTTASGLLGILQDKSIWNTAYYCTNDESELDTGKGVLTPLIRTKTTQMINEEDQLVNIFNKRGVNIRDHENKFEQLIINTALHTLCVYITSFCIPNSKEDFLHGLLSQWRGYGEDGGYALQFSRKRLLESVKQINKELKLNYELQDVYYSVDNALKDEVLSHSEAFINAYLNFLEFLANFKYDPKSVFSPNKDLTGGPLESLIDFLIYTKNGHFGEEKECRLSILELVSNEAILPVGYYNRRGLIVPYTKTPSAFNILDCIDWIIIGPCPNMESRYNSLTEMIRKMGLNIKVRPSHIPFSRF